MSHKNPELTARSIRRRWGAVIALGAAVTAVGLASIVDRGNNSDPSEAWPAATASLAPPADAPYLQSSEAPKPAETHKNMANSKDPGLKALAALEKKTGYGFKENMLFAGMPRNPEEAAEQGSDMAARLREYAKQGVKPIVVMEPTYPDPHKPTQMKLIDTAKLTNNQQNEDKFRETMDAYFGAIQESEAGTDKQLTNDQIGTWVPFPEPNIPGAGTNTDPETFKKNFAIVSQNLKAHFSGGKASVMLDSATYADNSWNNPDYGAEALKRYVTGIPEGLIDSVGFQGFQFSETDQVSTFLNPQPAAELANAAGTENIWLNTGTYSTYRDEQTGKRVESEPVLRGNTLAQESQTAVALQKAGFNVSVNLFAAPATDPAAPDWSYHKPVDQAILVGTVDAAATKAPDIPLSVFLTDKAR